MIDPSNFNEVLEAARKTIKNRIQLHMDVIMKEELEKAMGRVRILVNSDFNGTYNWYIQPEGEQK